MKSKVHLEYISLASVVSAISVVFLQCFWQFSATDSYWRSANIIESVFYSGVMSRNRTK